MAHQNRGQARLNAGGPQFRDFRLQLCVDLIADGVAVEDARRHRCSGERS